MLCFGEIYLLSTEEKHYLKQYLVHNGVINENVEVQIRNVQKFKRALFKSELHSMEYAKVQSKSSATVAIQFTSDRNQIQTYFGRIQKFFKFEFNGSFYRVASVTVFYPLDSTKHGTERIQQTREYREKGKVVDLESIDRKVIFFGTRASTSLFILLIDLFLSE